MLKVLYFFLLINVAIILIYNYLRYILDGKSQIYILFYFLIFNLSKLFYSYLLISFIIKYGQLLAFINNISTIL